MDRKIVGELIVQADTIFKKQPVQSYLLDEKDRLTVHEGKRFNVLAHDPGADQNIRCTFDRGLGPNNYNTWYVFDGHVNLKLDESPEDADIDNETLEKRQDGIKLPGFSSIFYLSDPILKGGNFTWSEATKNGNRIPVSKDIVENIRAIAAAMEEIRTLFGNRPVHVTSWYRDPATNTRVGGAPRSRHLNGDAVDFYIEGITPAAVQAKLDPWWGHQGGLASARTFTHIDQRGYRARWSYGR